MDSLRLLFQIRHHVKKSFTVNLYLTFHGARPTRSSTNLCERNHGFDVTPIWFIDKGPYIKYDRSLWAFFDPSPPPVRNLTAHGQPPL